MYPILAIDQGTTSTKAYLRMADGTTRLAGSRGHSQLHPHPGWVEHDPLELLENIRALLAAAAPFARLGLANQGETVVAWDAQTKRPLHNAIVWQDNRTSPETERLKAAGLEAETLARAGLPLDPYFSATKLRWLLDNTQDARALHRQGRLRLGTSDAFFIDCLTGTFATDVSTASRTSLLNLRTLQWDETLCALFGVPLECLPEIRPTAGDFGQLPGGATLTASAVDQQAALFGHGCQQPGDIKITFGTGAFALGLTGAAPVMGGTTGLLPTAAWQIGAAAPQFALEGGILTAGSALEWLRGIGLLADFAEIDALSGPSAAAQGVFFVPALAGLGCPYWDRTARGAWLGLSLETPRAALIRAVVEGIALRAAELAAAFAKTSPLARVSIDGGLSRSTYFTQFLANALGHPVSVAASADLTALGMLQFCESLESTSRHAGQDWQVVTPQADDFTAIHMKFASAVACVRGHGAQPEIIAL
ncbi:carbohydrate kinase [Acidocella aquatica]|uniref:ATP:glycerol 3-phosphotransferase n=1 Tax=Acidocella aquatica TaxID=1922313 RepID=A0ABQ6A1Q8_9PROT|nr:FGGY family carbohydrate kinase [Acidocella aquatica]GLR66366.1 carbohydrate kinase [Acidocella aquatica]